MSDWRPIATAPKDETSVLLYGPWAGEIAGETAESAIHIGYYSGRSDYDGFDWAVVGGDYYATWCKPTHWMPLPPPPNE